MLALDWLLTIDNMVCSFVAFTRCVAFDSRMPLGGASLFSDAFNWLFSSAFHFDVE